MADLIREALAELNHLSRRYYGFDNKGPAALAALTEVEAERDSWKETADERYETQTRYKLRVEKAEATVVQQAEALRLAADTISRLAEQQAMDDDWYEAPLAVIRTAIAEPPADTSHAHVRIGPPTPGNISTWEVVVGEGQMASLLALRSDETTAQAFADGYNLYIRHHEQNL